MSSILLLYITSMVLLSVPVLLLMVTCNTYVSSFELFICNQTEKISWNQRVKHTASWILILQYYKKVFSNNIKTIEWWHVLKTELYTVDENIKYWISIIPIHWIQSEFLTKIYELFTS